MRCKEHLTDLSSSVGVCATCLRELLLELIAARTQRNQLIRVATTTAADDDCRKHDPTPRNFPRSVSPYVGRGKSDDDSGTWILHQRFYSTPQVGPTYGSTTTGYFESAGSFKKNRFSLFSNLFRCRSEKFDLDPRVNYQCDEPPPSSASPSWFATIFAVRRKKKQSSKASRVEGFDQFGPGDRRSCRVIDRGMSPAVEVDSGDECDRPPSGGSPEASPQRKRTPTPARRFKAGTRNVSGLAFCFSPLVWTSPNRHWNQKVELPPDMSFTGEPRPSTMKPHLATAAGFRANRSRKLADFGRVNHNS
ncbi:putative purine permease 11-like isoform X1 [Hibiscus syriacus]|uniref:Purine permease 11-like isoform X1 n=1 Tax=Hibiscus syriacus TaxID=106335 RepID=A0A6A2Y690_HIBSY|nr:uncharacterized protein LOC120165355 [Hibiscus syriacus]KAE8676805.1 putative purine permease 11-like isoform X1 [Hibiscus syriacus]